MEDGDEQHQPIEEAPVWKVYPQSWYDIGSPAPNEVWPPLDIDARQKEYLASGTRYTAVAVILAHRWLMPHLLVINQNAASVDGRKHTGGLFSTRINQTESLREQLTTFVTAIYQPKPETAAAEVLIGSLLATLYVTPSGNYTSPPPVLPLHCTRPREVVMFYQVQLGHNGSFKLPADCTLKAIPLTDLGQTPSGGSGTDGCWMRSIPYILSRFKFIFFDSDDTGAESKSASGGAGL